MRRQNFARKLPAYQKAGYLSNVKKGMTITLLMIFFLYNTGWYVMYILSARQVKQEVRTYIRNHPGIVDAVFTFDLRDGEVADELFTWEEDGREFSYNGSMYDVISSQEKDGKLVLKCVDDKSERALKSAMVKMNSKHRVKSGFSFSPFSDKQEKMQVKSPAACEISYNLVKEADLQLIQLPLFVPPPDVV